MTFKIKLKDKPAWFLLGLVAIAAITVGVAFAEVSSKAPQPKTFGSAEEAVKALVAAVKNNHDQELLAILGPAGEELIYSGDAEADKQGREQFLKAYDEKNRLVPESDGMVLVIGQKDWPYPIPLVKKGTRWFFDTKRGKEEILHRRIGKNELNAIQVCLAVVDAQREYAMLDRDGDGLLEYAEKFASDSGKQNGLYWETKATEEPSPLGELMARTEGYFSKDAQGNPQPYHGYYYRMLTAQGKNAAGGAYDFAVKGNVFGGFAVVAYPATYGNSGVMTFIVNHDGVVYQKDLGKDTKKAAQAMKIFDPDQTWAKVQ